MQKHSLVIAGFLTLSVVGLAILSNGVGSATSAGGARVAPFHFTLNVGGANIVFSALPMGQNIVEINGVFPNETKNIAISGTVYLEGNNARFGLTLHNAIDGFVTVTWEFVINLGTRAGSGRYKWMTGSEEEGTITVGPPLAADSGQPIDLRAFGFNAD